jgi:hypothetical protein
MKSEFKKWRREWWRKKVNNGDNWGDFLNGYHIYLILVI